MVAPVLVFGIVMVGLVIATVAFFLAAFNHFVTPLVWILYGVAAYVGVATWKKYREV